MKDRQARYLGVVGKGGVMCVSHVMSLPDGPLASEQVDDCFCHKRACQLFFCASADQQRGGTGGRRQPRLGEQRDSLFREACGMEFVSSVHSTSFV